MRKEPAPGSASSPLRILIADDHPALRLGVKAVLRSMKPPPTVVAAVSNGQDAVDRYRELRPDMMTVDLRMPLLDGLAAIEQIIAFDPAARVLILTMHDSEEDVFQGFRAGALGYILKSAPRKQIIEAIVSVGRGEAYVPQALANKIALRRATPELTAREHEVLDQLRLGLSNKEIADALSVAPGTVKTHVRVILTKLGAMSRTEAVNLAIQRGLLR